jgi:MFS family permease
MHVVSRLPRTSVPDELQRLLPFLSLTFAAGVLGGPVSSLLSVYVESTLHQPPTFTSHLLAIQLAMTGLFALVGGALADRVGQRRALLLGWCGLPLATLIFQLHDFWILAIVVVALGTTNSLQTVAGQSYVVASAGQKRLGGMTAFYYLGNTLGGAVGNLIVGPIADRFGFGAVGVAGFVLSWLSLAVAFRRLPNAPDPTRRVHADVLTLARSYAALLRRPRVALVGCLRFFPTCFYGTTGLLVPLLIFRLSGSVTVAAVYGTANLLVATGAQIVAGHVVDRRGPFGLARWLSALALGSAVCIALAVHSLPGLFLFGVVATSTLWSMSTTMTSLVREVTAENERGRALGLIHLLWAAGMLVGTLVGGALVSLNPSLPFALFATLSVVPVLAAWALARHLGR